MKLVVKDKNNGVIKMKLKEVLDRELKKEDTSEITFISVHGIETTVSKHDKLREENDLLYIIRESGEIEIILFTDDIFKIKINKIHTISAEDIYAG